MKRNVTMAVLCGLLLLGMAACTRKGSVQPPRHPNAVSQLDSDAYDVLTAAQGAIDQAKQEKADGTLPAVAEKPLSELIASYNVTRAAWLTYRDAVKGGQTGQPIAALVAGLQTDVANVVQAVANFKAAAPAPGGTK